MHGQQGGGGGTVAAESQADVVVSPAVSAADLEEFRALTLEYHAW